MDHSEVEVVEDFGSGYFVPYQRALWDLFEKPQSSHCAKMISLLSIGLVLISTLGMCLNTFPWMQSKDVNGEPVDNPKLALVEAICISYFTVEFLIRLAGSPDKLQFLKGTMNVVDCLAIAPYYLDLFLAPPPQLDPEAVRVTVKEAEDEDMFNDVGRIMQVLRIARLMRIFKLARRSVGLQSMAHTVKTSWKVRQSSSSVTVIYCPGPGTPLLSGHHGHVVLREPGVLHRERGGGHWVLLHPAGHVVGRPDPHLPRLR